MLQLIYSSHGGNTPFAKVLKAWLGVPHPRKLQLNRSDRNGILNAKTSPIFLTAGCSTAAYNTNTVFEGEQRFVVGLPKPVALEVGQGFASNRVSQAKSCLVLELRFSQPGISLFPPPTNQLFILHLHPTFRLSFAHSTLSQCLFQISQTFQSPQMAGQVHRRHLTKCPFQPLQTLPNLQMT